MEIIEINSSATSNFEMLVDALSQQMDDIGSIKSRSEIEASIQNALKPDSRALFFLAMQDNITIGTVFVNICSGIESGGDYVWINEIQIAPDQRGKGHGKALLQHVVEWSKSKNMKSIFGIADTSNVASQALFKSEKFMVDDIKWLSRGL